MNAKEAVISRYPEAFAVIGPYFINIFADPSRDDSMNHLGCALFKHGEMAAWEDAFERTSEDDQQISVTQCVICEEVKPVCCDDDGEPMCSDCCHQHRPHFRSIQLATGGTFERMDCDL